MGSYKKLSDIELTNLLKSGDQFAFTEVYDRYLKVLYGIAYNRLRNTQTAEDVVHDVLVSLWKNRDTAEIENLSAYLATATKYMIFHKIKRLQKFSSDALDNDQLQLVIDDKDVEDRMHYKRLLEMVNEEVEKLPKKCRLIFKYSREEYLSNKEISEKLNISTSTVENQINTALSRLRKKVKNAHLILF